MAHLFNTLYGFYRMYADADEETEPDYAMFEQGYNMLFNQLPTDEDREQFLEYIIQRENDDDEEESSYESLSDDEDDEEPPPLYEDISPPLYSLIPPPVYTPLYCV